MKNKNERAALERGPKTKTMRVKSSKVAVPHANHPALAELLERGALILGKSIYRNRLTSPDVSALEEGLRVVFEDAAAFHREQAAKSAPRVREAA